MENRFDLSNLGYRELELVEQLLQAYIKDGAPDTFYNKGVKIAFNPHTGDVFLTNCEYQVAMLNGDKLEVYYSLNCTGYEGFIDDLYDDFKNGNIDPYDYESLIDYLKGEGKDDEAKDVQKAYDKEFKNE